MCSCKIEKIKRVLRESTHTLQLIKDTQQGSIQAAYGEFLRAVSPIVPDLINEGIIDKNYGLKQLTDLPFTYQNRE